ncbi:TPA: hypothetical protein U1729_001331 [Streptococcus suis]|nr:hypothetical protein [Streptococcus suis]HEM5651228.1 hypothetical protein [Streptococcus suis]
MTEAILTLGIFAAPMLAVAVLEQRKAEKERKLRETALLLETEFEKLRYKTWAQAEQYYKTCRKESMQNSLKRSGQQVDKEWKRYAEMVG